jgi:hypothetical protein
VAAQGGGKHELSARLARYAEDPVLLTSQSLARGEGQGQDDDESGATEGRAKLEMLQVEGDACRLAYMTSHAYKHATGTLTLLPPLLQRAFFLT